MKTIEIYFKDLTKEKQEEVMDAVGISWGETTNWDIIPLATVSFREDKND